MTKPVDPDILPSVAVIVTSGPPLSLPSTGVSSPVEESVAMPDKLEPLHVTNRVKSCVLESEYVPVAMYCKIVTKSMVSLAGVTAMETSTNDEAMVIVPCQTSCPRLVNALK